LLHSAASEAWHEPREAIRGLIGEVSVEPAGDQPRIILKGNLAGMLRLAQESKRPSTDRRPKKIFGCGRSQPTLSAALATCGVKPVARRRSAFCPPCYSS
jgi:hypothetical protein